MSENDNLSNGSSKLKKKSEQPKQPQHHIIDYNKDLEYLLKDNAEECESLGILHRASYEKYNRLSNYINIPVIILSSAIGFATGIDIGYEKMNIILGIGSIFVGIIKSIDTYFQLGKRSESHRLCSLQYQQVHKKIQIELALKRQQRQTAKDMMAVIKTDIKNLQDISPLIDQDIIDSYNEKYSKYTTVKKPNFVNGLTEVVVNSTADGDGEDVLHSRPRSESGSLDGNESDGGENGENGGNGGGGGGSRRGSLSMHTYAQPHDAVKIDAFGTGGGFLSQTNNGNNAIKNGSLTALANLVFKKRNGVTVNQPTSNPNPNTNMNMNMNDAISNQSQLQQLQQLQQRYSTVQPQGRVIPTTSTLSPILALNQNQLMSSVSAAPVPPTLVSVNNSRALSLGSDTHTPNSEIIAVTGNLNAGNVTDDAPQIQTESNVVVTIIPYDPENGSMM